MQSEAVEQPPVIVSHDADLQIATGTGREARKWRNQTIKLSALVDMLRQPQRTPETVEQFHRMGKSEQDTIKDVGGFVGGLLKGGRRNKASVSTRSLLTFDADYAGKDFVEVVKAALPDVAWLIYSTHKHTPTKPRLRLVVPMVAPCTVEQYEPTMRKIAEKVGMDRFDDSTYEINRLMYWPSCSSDGDYVFEYQDAALIVVEDVLREYGEGAAWQDTALWPTSSRESSNFDRRLKRQQPPHEKKGVVGAWCRIVGIHDAISGYLSDVYQRESDSRYTYVEGTTSNGLVIYDDQFAYSNHGTDPAQGELCNAFDLVRLHKFGHLDDEAKEGTPSSKLPSYQAMSDFAREREDVRADMVRSQMENVDEMFDAIAEDKEGEETDEESDEWLSHLQTDDQGNIKPTFFNAVRIMEGDSMVNHLPHYNELAMRVEKKRSGAQWASTDSYTVREYVGKRYGTDFPETKIEQAIENRAHSLSFHPVREYLEGLEWDGVPRVDSIFVDWFGADDTAYMREVGRCWLLAAVRRVYQPGYKFDHVPVLGGPQGIGKTSFIEVMARRRWYSELSSFDPKVAMEETQGAWLVELNELGASNKSELEQQKAFISARATQVRMAYARHSTEFQRQFVLIGTTNESEYLKDSTGNRRWWPIDCARKLVDLDELDRVADQIWAEAHERCVILGEEPIMSDEAKALAHDVQAEKVESDDWEGVIIEWLAKEARGDRYDEGFDDSGAGARMEERERVCVPEIAEDCLGISAAKLDKRSRMRIARVMDSLEGWDRRPTLRFGSRFGRQKGWLSPPPF